MKFFVKMLMCFTLVFATSVVSMADTRVPVLLYHSVQPEVTPEADPEMHVSVDVFTEQLKALKDNGYVAITYDQYVDYVKNGTPIPEKSVIINFDDGYVDNYLYA